MPFAGLGWFFGRLIGKHLIEAYLKKDGIAYIWMLAEGGGFRVMLGFILGALAADEKFRHAFSFAVHAFIDVFKFL